VTGPIPVVAPYVATIWAKGTTAYFNPDSIDSDGVHIWGGYQNKTTKDGTDGGPGFGPTSTIVEYSLDGSTVFRTAAVTGHVDGVRVDPVTANVWVTTNEDGSAHLFVIDHATFKTSEYTLPSPLPHGGGLDDLGFVNGKMFVAASAPAKNPNTDPALYVVTTSGTTATLTPAFAGTDMAIDYDTDAGAPLNLTDPDSITIHGGQLVLSSQGDSRLVFVTNAGGGAAQRLSTLAVATQLDDTVWATKAAGQLLVVDAKANTIYSLRKTGGFTVGSAFTETPDDSTVPNIVGALDLATGSVSPIAVGFKKATGLLFLADP
jgi:DNA-binding beta-propeller fold protein YncE